MDDLTELRDAWGQPDPPSQTAHSAARAALMRQIDADGTPVPALKPLRRRGVRLAWLTGVGTAVTVALAAAVVFTIAPGTTQPEQPAHQASGPSSGPSSGQPSSQLSSQQILLAAATVAEAKPAGGGTYWHIKASYPISTPTGISNVQNTWTAHDGTEYVMLHDGSGDVVEAGRQVGLGLGLDYEQLEQLPTDPAALKAWITDFWTHPQPLRPVPPKPGEPMPPVPVRQPVPADALPGQIAYTLSELLWQVPAPPAVRAAAFRALASMPNVTNLGPMDGGQALRISVPPMPADKFRNGKVPEGTGHITLVIDPATSMLLSQTNYQGTIKIFTAEWTNDMPKIVQWGHK